MSDDREKFIKRYQSDIAGDIDRSLSTSRWLLENGLIDESIRENLVCYGYLASEDVVDFEVTFDIKKKSIHYRFFLEKEGLDRYNKYLRIAGKKPTSIFGKWLKLRALKKLIPDGGHCINIESNIKLFLRNFLPDFSVRIDIYDIADEDKISAFVEENGNPNVQSD